MDYPRKHLQLKQEIALFQNEFLLLFLKYKLSFHCNLPENPNLITQFKKKKSFLVHCIFHAVFGNETTKDPVIKIDLVQSLDNLYWLEIESSGAPDNFLCSGDGFGKDIGQAKYFMSIEANPLWYHDLKHEAVEIRPAKDFKGSLIRLMLP